MGVTVEEASGMGLFRLEVPADGAVHMVTTGAEEQAWNEAQLQAALDRPRFAVWRYREPAIVLGVGQPLSPTLEAAGRAHGVTVLRRQTGGGSVLTGPWMVSASIALPCSHPVATFGIAESFAWFGAAHLHALAAVGVTARHARPDEIAQAQARAQQHDIAWACFATLSHGELVDAAGRKLTGLAQRRRRQGTLLVGATLVGEPPWERLVRVFGRGDGAAQALREATAVARDAGGAPLHAERYARQLARSLSATRDLPDGRGGTIPGQTVHEVALIELSDFFAIIARDPAILS